MWPAVQSRIWQFVSWGHLPLLPWPSSTPGSRRTQARLETPHLGHLETRKRVCFDLFVVAVGAWVQWCVARDGKKTADIRTVPLWTVANWGGLQGSRCWFASVPWMQWTKMTDPRDSRIFFTWFSLSQILGTCISVDSILPPMIWKASQLKTNRCIHGTLLCRTCFNSKARKLGPIWTTEKQILIFLTGSLFAKVYQGGYQLNHIESLG